MVRHIACCCHRCTCTCAAWLLLRVSTPPAAATDVLVSTSAECSLGVQAILPATVMQTMTSLPPTTT